MQEGEALAGTSWESLCESRGTPKEPGARVLFGQKQSPRLNSRHPPRFTRQPKMSGLRRIVAARAQISPKQRRALQSDACGATNQNFLFAQVLECDLNTLIVERLKVASKLVAAVGGAIEELAYLSDRGVRVTFKDSRAP
jgi:hypothetical protein